MQIKKLNSYRITFKNGKIENINAQNIIEALENVTQKDSPVVQVFMRAEGVDTVAEEFPPEIFFTSVVAENAGGSIATPASGKVHEGDSLAFKAIADTGYVFVSWSRNGEVISQEPSFVYEMEALAEGEDTAVFTATFKKAPISWVSEVSPKEATGAGCVAFPAEGVAEAGDEISLIAVEADGYTFDHWERNGESIGTNKILETTVSPLASGENVAVYKAVFTVS